VSAASTKSRPVGADAPLTPLSRHKVESELTSAMRFIANAMEALQDASQAPSSAQAPFKCAFCGEPIADGTGFLGWSDYEDREPVTLYKNALGSDSCDSEYQRRWGVLRHSWDLVSFIDALDANRL
jgi:hypothetical protein